MLRVGLLSDTHIPSIIKEPQPELRALLQGVDVILHAGDIYVVAVLDWLEAIAPVYAADGGMDPEDDPRVREAHLLGLEGHRLGLIHDYIPGSKFTHLFDGSADLIVCGHTHVYGVAMQEGVPVINPGSSTFTTAHSRMDHPGNAGILVLTAREAHVRFYELSSLEPPVVGGYRHTFS